MSTHVGGPPVPGTPVMVMFAAFESADTDCGRGAKPGDCGLVALHVALFEAT
jgi:hypothetical protein